MAPAAKFSHTRDEAAGSAVSGSVMAPAANISPLMLWLEALSLKAS